MIADMSKYINALREKGRELFNSYLALKKHLEELKYTIDKLERENDQKKEVIAQVKGEMETWKGKARDLQTQVSTEFSLKIQSTLVIVYVSTYVSIILAKGPPLAAFCSPFGGGRYKSCRMNKNYTWDTHTHIWDRHTNMGQTHTHGTDTYGTDTHMGQTHTNKKQSSC